MLKEKGYPTIDVKRTGLNLKRLCKENSLSVALLQDYLGLACPQTIYRWFSGQALPSLDHLFALSYLLDLPIEKILVKELLFKTGSMVVMVHEPQIIKNWEFIMRAMDYRKKGQNCNQIFI